ncbi:hypothetical protein [Spirosoma panaciterrae]|uniref:hypothetical protein n=1 Tax=Spirosoma panaciterrae TaxID=496058 RepID=UPI0003A3D33F|nr:hypothetical protein [Spirosoma panaciterrae]
MPQRYAFVVELVKPWTDALYCFRPPAPQVLAVGEQLDRMRAIYTVTYLPSGTVDFWLE